MFIIHTSMLWFFKRALQLNNIISSIAAYLIGAINHFFMNNFFTFNDSNAIYKRRVLGYIVVVLCNFILNTLAVNIVLKYIADNVLLSTVVSTATTTCFSFLVLSKIVYANNNGNFKRKLG